MPDHTPEDIALLDQWRDRLLAASPLAPGETLQARVDRWLALGFSTAEAAAVMGVDYSYVRLRLRRGQLPALKPARDWFVPIEVALHWRRERAPRRRFDQAGEALQ